MLTTRATEESSPSPSSKCQCISRRSASRLKSGPIEQCFCPRKTSGRRDVDVVEEYICLLTMLFGAGCSHLTEVQGIYQVLVEEVAVYQLSWATKGVQTLFPFRFCV
jgi:hypothetical protein